MIIKVIDFAMAAQGCWYVWGGKGDMMWTPQGLSARHSFPVYDCSGLITDALRLAGGPDWRATHSANVLFTTLPKVEPLLLNEPARWLAGTLLFYGDKGHASHVALVIGGNWMVEAAGGDSTCTSVEIARERNARVRVSRVRGSRLLGARLLPSVAP